MLAYDPFQIGALLGVANRQRVPIPSLSAKTLGRLESYKLNGIGIGEQQAKRLLKELDRRRTEGLATHRQVALLVAKEVPQEFARQMHFEAASEDLDIIIGERKRA